MARGLVIAVDDSPRFIYEWESGDGVTAPELAATWARLELWVGEECVTQVEEAQSASSRRGIYCSLYPLAEWVAYNWWFLQAHVRPASLGMGIPWRKGAGWVPHHSLRSAGDGFLWPDLLVLPEGDITRLLWHQDARSFMRVPIRYLSGGEALVRTPSFVETLRAFVGSVIGRLDEQGVQDTVLHHEWAALEATDAEERDFCLAVARLGLDPYDVGDEVAHAVEKSAEQLDSGVLTDFLNAVTPSRIVNGLAWIHRSSKLIAGLQDKQSEMLASLRASLSGSSVTPEQLPWTRGYGQARRVREWFDLSPVEAFDTAGLVVSKTRLTPDRALQGVGGMTLEGAGALVVGRKLKRADARFANARALWHFAFEQGANRFLLTPAHAEQQRVERAFAAELLAPGDGIRELIIDESGLVTPEDVEDVADHFDVAPLVVRHQVENQLALQVA